ncbi:TetR/AcrR family transcriptional regulator [Calidifontibacter sp. DB0510]|uniref:TetR/AcrR family transcriptional regulator n=1 Tax=Metallococcus carri TaxID=1656884 RepID=A0A967B0L4_9MICO|nr:TetR/AcrR family transcriptional regulator [Metallococcus carri]NHN55220.1 TetR/AcrR family transcriptional regulator [Metallococcus carri]NOP36297.1 TetR/AcrR family transcriptional regulator [Calidifontibacter sp. DB2511S]
MDLTPSPDEPGAVDEPRVDGRDARWTSHRVKRRRTLVEAAIKAIRRHGATVGMEEIASEAATSKTVIYRHLGDRLGLYFAVCEAVDAQILGDFDAAIARGAQESGVSDPLRGDPFAVIRAVIDSYLSLVERDPELYRFVIRRPLVDLPGEADPVTGLTDAIATRLAGLFTAGLAERGAPTDGARYWAHGLVGFVREAADRWLATPDRPPRQDVVEHLARFAAVGLTGVLDQTPTPNRGERS